MAGKVSSLIWLTNGVAVELYNNIVLYNKLVQSITKYCWNLQSIMQNVLTIKFEYLLKFLQFVRKLCLNAVMKDVQRIKDVIKLVTRK